MSILSATNWNINDYILRGSAAIALFDREYDVNQSVFCGNSGHYFVDRIAIFLIL